MFETKLLTVNRGKGLLELVYKQIKVPRDNNSRYEGYMRSDFRGWDFQRKVYSQVYVGAPLSKKLEDFYSKEGVELYYV